MVDSETRKWRRRRDARPAELTAAALGLFAERGFAATRLEDVAARTGVSKATIYRYFANKEALFEAVVKEAIAPRFAEAEVLVSAFEGSTVEMLKLLLNVMRQALTGPMPIMVKLIISESGNFPKLAQLWADLVVSRALRLIAGIVERGVERGEFRRVEPTTVAPLVAAPVILLAMYKQTLAPTGLRMEEGPLLDAHLEFLLRALRPTEENAR